MAESLYIQCETHKYPADELCLLHPHTFCEQCEQKSPEWNFVEIDKVHSSQSLLIRIISLQNEMGQQQLRSSSLGNFEQLGQKSAQEKYHILKELLQAKFEQEEEKEVENMRKMNTKLTQENVEFSIDRIDVIPPNVEHQRDANVAFQPQANRIQRQRCVCWNTKEQKVWIIVLIVLSILLFGGAVSCLAFQMPTFYKQWLGTSTQKIPQYYENLPQLDIEQIMSLKNHYISQVQIYWEDTELDENMKKNQLMLLFLYLGDLSVDQGHIQSWINPDYWMFDNDLAYVAADHHYCRALYYAYWSQDYMCPVVEIDLYQSNRAYKVLQWDSQACGICDIDPYVEYGFSPFYSPTQKEKQQKQKNFWMKNIPEIQNRLRLQYFMKHRENGVRQFYIGSNWIGFATFLNDYFDIYIGLFTYIYDQRNLSRISEWIPRQEFDQLFLYYDQNKDGSVEWNEFVIGFQDNMSELRNDIIQNAFEYLDEQKTGRLSLDGLLRVYDASKHPKVLEERYTYEQVHQEIENDLLSVSEAGFITYDRFYEYYLLLSAFIPIDNDQYFLEMVQNTWGIPNADEENRDIIDALLNESNLEISTIQKDLIEDRIDEFTTQEVSSFELSADVSNNLSWVYLFIELVIFLVACIGLLYSYLWFSGKGKKKIVETSIPYTRMEDK